MTEGMVVTEFRERRGFVVPVRIEKQDAPVAVGGMFQIVGGGIAEKIVETFLAHPGSYNVTITVEMEKL